MIQILQGDCLERLRDLPDESIQCCVTSPPYWGLRDYGVEGQLGLEKTPDEYVSKMVDVFREVRRVLREDGTLWLNLGDSYAGGGQTGRNDNGRPEKDKGWATYDIKRTKIRRDDGLKPKDLVGIPWRVAFALQQPYYIGRIKRVEDRIWLAAMLEAEGCLFIHKRKAGQSNGQGYQRQSDTYSPGLEIANTHEGIIRRCIEIAGVGSVCSQSPDQNNRRKQTIFRWNLRTTESRDLVRELYPYIVAKRQQARIFCGCPTSGREAEAAHAALKLLHNGHETTVDFKEPATMFKPGWYLRSDVIWSKPNPMPESVTDRPTKSHEYIFLMSKSARYYYDYEAIKVPASESYSNDSRWETGATNINYKDGYADAMAQNPKMPHRVFNGERRTMVNIRDVWTITTAPYTEAHFATFPPDLIKPCILAGTKSGDTVLDPFGGSGTTGQVALELGRKATLIELNPDYVKLIEQRTFVTPGLAL